MEQKNRPIPFSEAYEKKLARGIKAYIARNLHRYLNAAGVAAHFVISPSSLQRLCRKYYGCSFKRFTEHCRMSRALHYLHKGKRIKEVMYLTGYTHRSTFNRAFRRIYHYPPRHFIRG